MNLNEKFMKAIGEIKEPVIFLGIVKILKVEIMEGNEPRDFTDMFADCMEKYNAAGRKRKKELLKILEDANKEYRKENKELNIDADRAEDS